MKINTSEEYAYRTELFERTAAIVDEDTTTEGVEAACLHVEQDVKNKEEAIEYLANELPPQQLSRVVKILSTDQVPIECTLDISVSD